MSYWNEEIDRAKCSFVKQHLNQKMPKCHFDVHLSKDDISDLFCTIWKKLDIIFLPTKYR